MSVLLCFIYLIITWLFPWNILIILIKSSLTLNSIISLILNALETTNLFLVMLIKIK